MLGGAYPPYTSIAASLVNLNLQNANEALVAYQQSIRCGPEGYPPPAGREGRQGANGAAVQLPPSAASLLAPAPPHCSYMRQYVAAAIVDYNTDLMNANVMR